MFAGIFLDFGGYILGYSWIDIRGLSFFLSLFPASDVGQLCADINTKSAYVFKNETWVLGPGNYSLFYYYL